MSHRVLGPQFQPRPQEFGPGQPLAGSWHPEHLATDRPPAPPTPKRRRHAWEDAQPPAARWGG